MAGNTAKITPRNPTTMEAVLGIVQPIFGLFSQALAYSAFIQPKCWLRSAIVDSFHRIPLLKTELFG